MADPRSVERAGIGARYQTFTTDNSTITYSATATGGSSQVGLAVTINSSDLIETVGDGEFVLGKLIKVEPDNTATVQTHGEMGLPGGLSATLTRGKSIVGDLGAASAEGYIREVATGTAAELGVARGFIDDPSTATDVRVQL